MYSNKAFSYVCKEGKKEVYRTVWLMTYTSENLRKLWEKSQSHRILFIHDVNGDFKKFCSVFFSEDLYGNISTNGLVWVVDDFVGILHMSDIKSTEANLHFSFFDARLRFDISQRMIQYIFDQYNFERLNAEVVPFASHRVFKFLEELGFRREGKRRKALDYKDQKYDILLYGILREEFEEKWDTKKRQLVEAQPKH